MINVIISPFEYLVAYFSTKILYEKETKFMVKIELNTREYNDNTFACNYIELKWPIFLNMTSAKFDWCDVKMADVMSFNSGHFGWCHLEKFRKCCDISGW